MKYSVIFVIRNIMEIKLLNFQNVNIHFVNYVFINILSIKSMQDNKWIVQKRNVHRNYKNNQNYTWIYHFNCKLSLKKHKDNY